MALIKCTECSSEVSDNATSCPKCGHPITAVKPKSSWRPTLAVLLGIGACWLWFGAHLYFIFPMDSAIFGGVLLLYGVIQFATQAQRSSHVAVPTSVSSQNASSTTAPINSGSPLKFVLVVGGICAALYLVWYFSPGGGYAQYKAQYNAKYGIDEGSSDSTQSSGVEESCEQKIKNFALKTKANTECDYDQGKFDFDINSALPAECKNTLGQQKISMLYGEALGKTMVEVQQIGHQAWCSAALATLKESSNISTMSNETNRQQSELPVQISTQQSNEVGKQPAMGTLTTSLYTPLLNPNGKITVWRCHMGECDWIKWLSVTVQETSPSEEVVRASLLSGNSQHSGGNYPDSPVGVNINWENSVDSMIFRCSHTTPSVSSADGRTDILSMDPDDFSGAAVGELAAYFAACHSEFGDTIQAMKKYLYWRPSIQSASTTAEHSSSSSATANSRVVKPVEDDWQFSENANGVVMTSKSKAATIYLGKSCDAVSPEYGKGRWEWANAGWSVTVGNQTFRFPGVDAPIQPPVEDSERCEAGS